MLENEQRIYASICSHEGIRAKEIAKELGLKREEVNHFLYASPFMKELCFQDEDAAWHGMIRQGYPHKGLGNFSGYYGFAGDFVKLPEEEWFRQMVDGCADIGRNLNDTRGLFHSFRDARETMLDLFRDLADSGVPYEDWEIVFELRIKRSRMIRIYADVLVITPEYVFSLEFKMKDVIDPEEVLQAAKYCPYLEMVFGPEMNVIPALVLTAASDLYTYVPIGKSSAELPVCAGDMLFNLFDEYLAFLN